MKENLRPGYGQILAEARKAKEMSPADVAAKLKLTVRQVEALEAEEEGQLPGDVFLRGFVRNYARLMELDTDEVITPMDAQAAVSETITAHSEGVTISSGGLKRWLLIPLVILGLFVIFVAVLYQWLRQGEDALLPQVAVEPSSAVVTQSLPLPSVVESAPQPQAAQQGSEVGTSDVTPAASEANAAKPAVVAPQAVETAPKPAASESEPAATLKEAPASAEIHVLRFLAAEDAWIQVVDGEGKRFSKLIRAGGTDSISGKAPFKLVVGEASQVRMTYDGHSIDLTPFIGQKVARLTLE